MDYIVPMFFGKVGAWLERGITGGSQLTVSGIVQTPQEMMYELQKTPLSALLPLIGGYAAVQYWGAGATDMMKYAYAVGGGAAASYAAKALGGY